jgi:DNA-binding GntR family transcriptional regulator
MAEHEAVVDALRAGEEQRAAEVLRGHVAIQGEKFHLLMSSLRDAAE